MMKPTLLLDTHAALWFGANSRKIPARLKRRIIKEGAFVSVLAPVELIIKQGSRRFKLPFDLERLFDQGLRSLPVQLGIHEHFERLPPIHKDPFDRMLVAQALQEKLILATADETLTKYPVATVWE
jgi:PIN domain nuclease of toxin-antitoxin system